LGSPFTKFTYKLALNLCGRGLTPWSCIIIIPCSALSPTTFDPVANFVSTVNVVCDCPRSLLTALAESHPDSEVWLQSYFEEKRGIESLGRYKKLSLAKYRALHEKGATKAIPTMCVLTIKPDEMLNPFRAKTPIMILATTKTVSGPCRTSTPLFYVRITCSLSSVWPLNSTGPSSKVIVKTPSVKAFYLWTRSLSSNCQFGIQKLPKSNIVF
jgi:hypothetical protein